MAKDDKPGKDAAGQPDLPYVGQITKYFEKSAPKDIRKAIDVPVLIRETNGNSFAEMEEIKSLLVQHYLDVKVWDLNHAIREFKSREKETLAVKEKLKDASKSEALTE